MWMRLLRARALVERVDILGDEQEIAVPRRLEPGQRHMRGIGLDLGRADPPRVVEFMNQRRIARERLGSRDILDPVAFPQAVGGAERLQPALRADPGAGQDDDVTHNLPSFH